MPIAQNPAMLTVTITRSRLPSNVTTCRGLRAPTRTGSRLVTWSNTGVGRFRRCCACLLVARLVSPGCARAGDGNRHGPRCAQFSDARTSASLGEPPSTGSREHHRAADASVGTQAAVLGTLLRAPDAYDLCRPGLLRRLGGHDHEDELPAPKDLHRKIAAGGALAGQPALGRTGRLESGLLEPLQRGRWLVRTATRCERDRRTQHRQRPGRRGRDEAPRWRCLNDRTRHPWPSAPTGFRQPTRSRCSDSRTHQERAS